MEPNELIRQYLREHKLSLTTAARKWRISISTLSRIDRGSRNVGALVAFRIHRGTGGKLNKKELCPKIK